MNAIDLRTPKAEVKVVLPTRLVMRGVPGSLLVPPGIKLTEALAMVGEKVGERAHLLRDEKDVIGEKR